MLPQCNGPYLQFWHFLKGLKSGPSPPHGVWYSVYFEARGATPLHSSGILKLRIPVTSVEAVAKGPDCASLISAEDRDGSWRIVWWWLGILGLGAYCACASLQRRTHHLCSRWQHYWSLEVHCHTESDKPATLGVDSETSWHTTTTPCVLSCAGTSTVF